MTHHVTFLLPGSETHLLCQSNTKAFEKPRTKTNMIRHQFHSKPIFLVLSMLGKLVCISLLHFCHNTGFWEMQFMAPLTLALNNAKK